MKEIDKNSARFVGVITQRSSRSIVEGYMQSKICIIRKNTERSDNLVIVFPKEQQEFYERNYGKIVEVKGQVLNKWKSIDGVKRNVIYILSKKVQEIERENFNTNNNVSIEGYVNKMSNRITPKGIKITEIFLICNDSAKSSVYLLCITWESVAISAMNMLREKDKIRVVGRLQERQYDKKLENGTIEKKVAYEISCIYFNLLKKYY